VTTNTGCGETGRGNNNKEKIQGEEIFGLLNTVAASNFKEAGNEVSKPEKRGPDCMPRTWQGK